MRPTAAAGRGLPPSSESLAAVAGVRQQRRVPTSKHEEVATPTPDAQDSVARAMGTANGAEDWSALLGQVLTMHLLKAEGPLTFPPSAVDAWAPNHLSPYVTQIKMAVII